MPSVLAAVLALAAGGAFTVAAAFGFIGWNLALGAINLVSGR